MNINIKHLPERAELEQAVTTLLWQTSSVFATAQIAAKTATTTKYFMLYDVQFSSSVSVKKKKPIEYFFV